MDRYWARLSAACLPALQARRGLANDLDTFLSRFLDFAAGEETGGCVIASGLPAEVERWPALRDKLASTFAGADRVLAARLREAQREGELPATRDPEALAVLVTSALTGFSLRSRDGATRAELEQQAAALRALVLGQDAPADTKNG